MSDKDHIHLTSKYLDTMQWLNEITLSDPFLYNELIAKVKIHTLNITRCSSEKFDELKFCFDTLIYDEEDQPIVDCYYSYLDNIRKTHQ